jgi:hypothetical protein
LKAEISTDSATQSSGTAKITITFEGSTVYTNDKWKIKSNSAAITIPYDEFVVDNGEYTIFTEYEGVSDEITYEIDFVLTYVTITVYDNVFIVNQAQFTVSVGVSGENAEPLKDSEIMISSIEHEDGMHSITSGIGDWQEMAGLAEYVTTLDYQESGNYTFYIDVENNDVKDSSDYASYTIEAERLINAQPVSKFTWDDSAGGDGDGQIEKNENVEFDGGNSIDEGDLDYTWSISYSVSDTDPGAVVHTDEGEETSYDFNQFGIYAITLYVEDLHGRIHSETLVISTL